MTVALVLAAQPDAGQDAKLRGQLAALGVRRVDAAERAGPGLLTVAAAARAAGERVLICVGDDSLPEEVLARLLGAGGTAAFTGSQARQAHSGGALVVDTPDLNALADAAEALARDVARWAARRQLAPAALLGISLGLALLAAAWFSEPAVRAQVLASAALLVVFTMARAAVQLTITGRPAPAVRWLATATSLLT